MCVSGLNPVAMQIMGLKPFHFFRNKLYFGTYFHKHHVTAVFLEPLVMISVPDRVSEKIDIDNGVGKKDFSNSKNTFNDRVSYRPERAS